MTFQLKDKSGNPIDISKLPPEFAAILEPLHDSIVIASGNAVNATIKNATASLEQKFDGIVDQVTKLTEAKPDPKQTAPATTDPTDPNASAQSNQIMDSIAKLMDEVKSLKTENQAKSEAESSLKIATDYANKHHPTMKGKEQLIQTIAAGKPKDEDAARELVEQEKKRIAAYHGDEAAEKAFSSSPAEEGGVPAEDDAREAQLKEKSDALDAELANFK